jgi:hypothetical protein
LLLLFHACHTTAADFRRQCTKVPILEAHNAPTHQRTNTHTPTHQCTSTPMRQCVSAATYNQRTATAHKPNAPAHDALDRPSPRVHVHAPSTPTADPIMTTCRPDIRPDLGSRGAGILTKRKCQVPSAPRAERRGQQTHPTDANDQDTAICSAPDASRTPSHAATVTEQLGES